MSKIALAAVALSASLAWLPAGATTVTHYTSAYVFGDSLSDPGNLFALTDGEQPPSPPYYQGRFSNGPVWAEYLTQKFADKGLSQSNFAYGGATALESDDGVPDLPDQINDFKTGGFSLGYRPLATVWIGANDVLMAINENPSPLNVATTAAKAAVAVGAGISSLVDFGLEEFLIFNMAPLELTPQFALLSPPPAAQLAKLASDTYNATLAAQIAALSGTAKITLFDTHAAFTDLYENPKKYGVTDVTNPCILPGVSICTPEQAEERAFYDPVHANNVVQHDLAGLVLKEVAPVPLPAPLLLLVVGLAGLSLVGIRRRA